MAMWPRKPHHRDVAFFLFEEYGMRASEYVNRRSVVLGLGALTALTAFKGCSGGGSGSSDGGGGGASSGLTGSFWYQATNNNDNFIIKVPGGGTGTPVAVGKALNNAPLARLQISRNSPRYLQSLYYSLDENVLLQAYDHGSNQPYCYMTVPGYVGGANVSPSGNFIGMLRSPSLVNAAVDGSAPGVENIIGMNIADISNPNTPRLIRSEFSRGPSCVIDFAWLDNDQFLYMTLDGTLATGSATAGSQGDTRIGKLNDQGMLKGGMDVHPDGTTMAVTLVSRNDSLAYDTYLYKVTGELIDRLTATGQGSSFQWSPDGKYFAFAHGDTGSCGGSVNCGDICSSLYAPSNARSVTRSSAQAFDKLIVPCTGARAWSSVA
jgi:hypothetical protein